MRTGWLYLVAALGALWSAAVLTRKLWNDSKYLDIAGGISARPTDREWHGVETMDDPRDEYGAPEGGQFFGGRS